MPGAIDTMMLGLSLPAFDPWKKPRLYSSSLRAPRSWNRSSWETRVWATALALSETRSRPVFFFEGNLTNAEPDKMNNNS
eukprot:s2479_g6.t1